jgi:hypothetical protein
MRLLYALTAAAPARTSLLLHSVLRTGPLLRSLAQSLAQAMSATGVLVLMRYVDFLNLHMFCTSD